jgi:hypothetical protein
MSTRKAKYEVGDPVICIIDSEIRFSSIVEVDTRGTISYKIDLDSTTKKHPWYSEECLYLENVHNAEIATRLIRLKESKDLIALVIQQLKNDLYKTNEREWLIK